eukprot:Awhi_evm1s2659
MFSAQQLQYLENNYGALAVNLTFENIHTDATVANLFRLFLIRQYCCENLESYEKILEFENMFNCRCISASHGYEDPHNAVFDFCSSMSISSNDSDSMASTTSSDCESIRSSTQICGKCTDKNQIIRSMLYIIKQFISSNGESEVHLPAKIKNDLLQRFASIQGRPSNINSPSSSFRICMHMHSKQLYLSDRFLFEKVKLEVRKILERDLFERFLVDVTTGFNACDHIEAKRTDSLDTFAPLMTSLNFMNHRNCNENSEKDYSLKHSVSLASLEKLQMFKTHDSLDLNLLSTSTANYQNFNLTYTEFKFINSKQLNLKWSSSSGHGSHDFVNHLNTNTFLTSSTTSEHGNQMHNSRDQFAVIKKLKCGHGSHGRRLLNLKFNLLQNFKRRKSKSVDLGEFMGLNVNNAYGHLVQ